jgi:hypothetical protein
MPARGSDLVYFVSHRDPSAGDQQARLEAIRMDGSGQQLVAMIPSLTAPADLAGAPRFRDFALSPAADQVVFVSYEDPSATPPTYAIVVSTLACSCLAKIRFAGDYRGPFWR